MSTFASTAMLLVLIVIMYLFLNMVTKGYFTNRLRLIAVIVAAAGTGAILLLFMT